MTSMQALTILRAAVSPRRWYRLVLSVMSANNTAIVFTSLAITTDYMTAGRRSGRLREPQEPARPRAWRPPSGNAGRPRRLFQLGEAHGQNLARREAARRGLLHEHQGLLLGNAGGNDHFPAGLQLRQQG